MAEFGSQGHIKQNCVKQKRVYYKSNDKLNSFFKYEKVHYFIIRFRYTLGLPLEFPIITSFLKLEKKTFKKN